MNRRLQIFDIVALFNQGLQAHNTGDLNAAERIYNEILAIQPDHCEANHNIGAVLVAKSEFEVYLIISAVLLFILRQVIPLNGEYNSDISW